MPGYSKYNKQKQSKGLESEEKDAILFWVIRESLTGKVTFEQSPEVKK